MLSRLWAMLLLLFMDSLNVLLFLPMLSRSQGPYEAQGLAQSHTHDAGRTNPRPEQDP